MAGGVQTNVTMRGSSPCPHSIHTTVRISRAVCFYSGVVFVEQATITKKVLITLDIITGQIEIDHDDMSYYELLGALEAAKMLVVRDFIEETGG